MPGPDLPASPISQLLHTLGITREDLEKRSNQMREFLTTENAGSLRVTEALKSSKPRSASIPSTAISAASSTRTRSRASSFRDATPSATPVKKESPESSVLLRHFDSMEMVIERQRRQSRKGKKERRERERENQAKMNLSFPRPPSPAVRDASHVGYPSATVAQGRDIPPVSGGEFQKELPDTLAPVPPVTPRRSPYYREHTEDNSNAPPLRKTPMKAESPAAPQPQIQCYPYPQYLAYAHLLQPLPLLSAQASASTLPVTPQRDRTLVPQRQPVRSPLPPSSPPAASSPFATPHRPHVNIVSSPGPMGPLPDEEEFDKLPFSLPPGPYSPHKPDASYAALVGQAILSSPEHRLTLQEIYDYITIVYPYFKRGEQTWMNSIRHVLSTTVCFRKVTRDRSLGRTQWAIWDEDLECFKGGGFRKHLCKDFMNGVGKDTQYSKGKGKGRKRDPDDAEDRKTKRLKKDHSAPLPSFPVPVSYVPTTLSSHPLFPPARPTPHLQPYYESCLKVQRLQGDVLFPPIPADIGYTRVPLTSPIMSTGGSLDPETNDDAKPDKTPTSTPSQSYTQSSSSVPELTQDRGSSPSSPPPATSEIDGDANAGIVAKAADGSCLFSASLTKGNDEDSKGPTNHSEDISALEDSFLVSVKDWGSSPLRSESQSLNEMAEVKTENNENIAINCKNSHTREFSKKMCLSIPTSPTLKRKAASLKQKTTEQECHASPIPSTPPRTSRQLPTSSIRTPLSAKGINPAALCSEVDDEVDGITDLNKTPRKRIPSTGLGAVPTPITPRRLVFPTNQNTSPFRTPAGGIFGTSPFRTPGSRGIFDPHDPSALLDEELNRVGVAGQCDSPAGLFGKGRGSLLYDSPGLSISPGRWW